MSTDIISAPAAAPPQQAVVGAQPAAASQPAVDIMAGLDAPAPSPAPAPATPPEAKPFRHTDEPTLLELASRPAPAVEAKPVEPVVPVKPVEAVAAAPASPADALAAAPAPAPAAPAPIDWGASYRLPDTIKMDDAVRGEVHAAFDAFRADPAKGAQSLMDLHAKQMQAYADRTALETLERQHRAFSEMRKSWQTATKADEQIGGSGYNTAMQAIARMRDQFVSTARPGTAQYSRDMQSFDDFLRVTGAGDHPVFNRLMHNVARFFDEPGLPPANPRPPADIGKPNGRRAVMYDHPRSNPNR